MKTIFKIIVAFLISILVIFLFFDISIIVQSNTNPDKLPSFFGYKTYIIMSGSMENELNIGDLIFVKETKVKDLEKNDIIAFKNSNNSVTAHRIVDIVKEDGKIGFKTKGDNNNIEDEDTVYGENIEGKYINKVPQIGNFIMFVQEPNNFPIILLVIVGVGLVIYIIESIVGRAKTNNEISQNTSRGRRFK